MAMVGAPFGGTRGWARPKILLCSTFEDAWRNWRDSLVRVSGNSRDPLFGWGPFVGGGLEIHQVPGHHKNMVFEPHARTLADTLGRCLAEAWEPHKDANGRVA